MTRRLAIVTAALGLAACGGRPAAPLKVAEMPAIDATRALTDIQQLASDGFQGRGPGSQGEELTVKYLSDQFKAAGLEPGNPDGTFVQKVPLVGVTPGEYTPLVVKHGGQSLTFKPHEEVVAFSQRVTENIELKDSELVFVGYGVQAPEYQWDDFRGVDVAGKTIVVLVNDPPIPSASNPAELDPTTFGGRAMTYYGRWTYKYDKAAQLGAAGVLIVHETGPAGYGFNVVQGFDGQRFGLVTPDKNMSKAAVQGWLSLDAATRLFRAAGLDYAKAKAQAATREFKPIPMKMTASMTFKQTLRTLDSHNVVAKLTGSDDTLKNEFVVYSAHWDHFGVGEAKNGDAIYNGAADNASGTAGLLEIARTFKTISPKPKRSILFLAVTAEEQGLLGSQYYAEFPLYPLDKTVANINIDDNLPMWGRTKDVIVIGLGASDLDDYLREAAAEQGRVLKPDAEPEKGFYYRSDHFNFAKVGVPALDTDDGVEYLGKPEGYGKQKKDEYTANDYHQPSDQVRPDWDLSGYAEQAQLLMAVGYRVANAERMPEWKPGNEFRAVREKSIKR
jgi:Zn-dependent M28 family amino/carboxypeptidase